MRARPARRDSNPRLPKLTSCFSPSVEVKFQEVGQSPCGASATNSTSASAEGKAHARLETPCTRTGDAVVDRMCASLREFGFKIPVLARSDGEVVDGHLRLKAARQLGITQVPVILCDEWSPAQVKAFRLRVALGLVIRVPHSCAGGGARAGGGGEALVGAGGWGGLAASGGTGKLGGRAAASSGGAGFVGRCGGLLRMGGGALADLSRMGVRRAGRIGAEDVSVGR
jgi:hypothetical protein